MPQSKALANTKMENKRRTHMMISWGLSSKKPASEFAIDLNANLQENKSASCSTLDLLTEASIVSTLVEQNCYKGASELQP
jgi:hypothetical protein